MEHQVPRYLHALYFSPSSYTSILNEVRKPKLCSKRISKVRQQTSLDTVLQHPYSIHNPPFYLKKKKKINIFFLSTPSPHVHCFAPLNCTSEINTGLLGDEGYSK
jgi:hypothetical protein